VKYVFQLLIYIIFFDLQKPINVFLNDLFFLLSKLFSFFFFFYAIDIFYTITEQNNKFFYMLQIQREEEIGC